ncbi:O-antigen ligase family protein [Rhodococcus sp. MEB064]|uniref:O-antigen ligase family protein n=1 Tax=Rhodococcus sp. MEB064 TaxID=1587522 RepID=UPI0005AC05B8|nr:O-antigen ligase family protein [Rhodococcus sp. MEB064]KIQ17602.1 hypothetical protein RU01_10720 [Rhodococcus sp. MEB064]
MKNAPAVVGLLLGTASAAVGVRSIVPGIPLRPWHILVFAALVLAWTAHSRRTTPRIRPLLSDVALLAFVGLSVAVELWNVATSDIQASITNAIYPLYFLVGYAAVRLVVRHRTDAMALLVAFTIPVVPSAVAALAQLASRDLARLVLTVAPAGGLSDRIDDGRTLRSTAFIGHWTGAGMYFCAILAAVGCVLLMRPRRRSALVMVWTAAVAAIAGALASATISVIATAAALCLVTAVAGGWRPLVFLSTSGIVAGALSFVLTRPVLQARVDQQTTPARTSSGPPTGPVADPGSSWIPSTLAYRYRVWTEQTLPAIADRPVTGWGADVFGSSARPPVLAWGSAESQWLGVALSFGVPAMVVFVLVIAAIASVLYRSASRMSAPVMTLFACSVASAFIVPVFTNRGLPVPFWILLGVVVALSPVRHAQRERSVRTNEYTGT